MIEEEKFKCRDVLNLGLSFWLLAISSMYIYMTVIPYMQTVGKRLQDKYNFDV